MARRELDEAFDRILMIQDRIVSGGVFRGYSGRFRAAGGGVALAAAAALHLSGDPSPVVHLTAWVLVAVFTAAVHYAIVMRWYLLHPPERRDPVRLVPTLDAAPGLCAGILFTVALWNAGRADLLAGSWMICYGMATLSARTSLPAGLARVGVYYLICGAFFLLHSGASFVNPWPMGVVFGAGEAVGGYLHFRGTSPDPRLLRFVFPGRGAHRS